MSNHTTSMMICSPLSGMENYLCWKADLSLGYGTSWEMIEGINKLILKSNQSQEYTNLTYLISTKMGANKNVTDYLARQLPFFGQLELSLRNSEGGFSQEVEEYLRSTSNQTLHAIPVSRLMIKQGHALQE